MRGIADCQLPIADFSDLRRQQIGNRQLEIGNQQIGNWQSAIGNNLMETLLKDIRYGFRGLLKRKAFAAIAVLTLALGIGANTAIFTLINAVMLKSLPVEKPEELVLFNDTTSEGTSLEDSPQPGVWQRFSYASYEYFRDHNQSFQDLAAFRSGESTIHA